MSPTLRDFLEIPYDQLEEMNLAVKAQRLDRAPADRIREERLEYLSGEKRIKAVTVCFSDLEGRLHMLDYDKKFLIRSSDNLTFDGSSVRGFARQTESDLRLELDWSAFRWLPADIFGPGKVLVFGEVRLADGRPHPADMRSRLTALAEALYRRDGSTCNVAPEIEGFLFQGQDAEHDFIENRHFEPISRGGYYHTLPGDPLRQFIDTAAEAQRALGFENEKDHPEVAPSQFEMNFSHTEATIAADQILLYKMVCRQVARRMNMTACFLPKPITGVNGSGMHVNLSISRQGVNTFYDPEGRERLSASGWDFVHRILASSPDLCLMLNSSVNAYRRLDPHYEAPNQIRVSAIDRTAMVRIPLGNARSARVEVRSIAPDANPYLVIHALLQTGLTGPLPEGYSVSEDRFLPDNIYDAIHLFRDSAFVGELLGTDVQARFARLKLESAERCPHRLGRAIKPAEVQFHHEVTNQYLWSQF